VALNALLGALGFLSRLPVGRSRAAWEAFRAAPTAFPVAGYVLGGLLALPLLLPLPAPTVALLFVAGVYAVTGINHVDGVADLGDAAVVHGDPTERRAAMRDTTVGVGAVLAVVLVVGGLGAAALALAALPARALLLVVAAEVGAKTGVALLICLGSASHEGLGSALTSRASPRSTMPVLLAAAPAALLSVPRPLPAAAAVFGALAVAAAVRRWARTHLGGVGGDAFGATNELARVVGLHAGVVTWTGF
jgi:adenosylcobinamide-GDP ribazoletransferase